jgi:hypothetical protein
MTDEPAMGPLRSLVVGSVPCPVLGASLLGARSEYGGCGDARMGNSCEILDVLSERAPATPACAEGCIVTFSDRWQPEGDLGDQSVDSKARTPVPGPCAPRVDPMEWEAELGACTPRQERRGERDVPSPDLGPWCSAHEDDVASLRALIDASPGLRGEKLLQRPIQELGPLVCSPAMGSSLALVDGDTGTAF